MDTLKHKWFVFLAVFALVGLTANLMFAKAGGIKVSATSVNCGDSSKETNVLAAGTNNGGEVWFNFPGNDGSNSIDRWYTISCRQGDAVDCTKIRLDYCGTSDPNYYSAVFDTIGTSPDRCTFTLYNDSSCAGVISSDSWRQ